jgi:hypothetical protein
MTNATETESQTTLKGTSCLLTRYQSRDSGIAPSLEKAYPILELLVTDAVPQRNMATAMAARHSTPPTPPPNLWRKVVYRACAMAFPPASLVGSRSDGMSVTMDVRATR